MLPQYILSWFQWFQTINHTIRLSSFLNLNPKPQIFTLELSTWQHTNVLHNIRDPVLITLDILVLHHCSILLDTGHVGTTGQTSHNQCFKEIDHYTQICFMTKCTYIIISIFICWNLSITAYGQVVNLTSSIIFTQWHIKY